MKKKLFLLGIVICFISVSTMAQSIRDNLDKLAKDPKTMENAAKADVYIVGKNKQIANKIPESNKSTSAVQPRKKKKSK